jgi:hypothetical protein
MLTNLHRKIVSCYETFNLVRFGPRQILWYDLTNAKGIFNSVPVILRACMLGSLTTTARELERFQLDLVGAQEVR